MVSISTPTTSKQSIVLAFPSSRTDEEDRIGYVADLSAKHTDIEINTDTVLGLLLIRRNFNILGNFIWDINKSLEREPQSEL